MITRLLNDIHNGTTTARALVEGALKRAKSTEEFHALLSLTEERALARADEIDTKIAAGDDVGKLAGIPFIAKDNMLAYGSPTTAAAKILENFDAPFQAEAIERLEREGAICIGKANLDAFAHGGSTENSAYGPTKNPNDKTRVPGGSSGGSAAAIALDIAPFALGTDTGGSIRQPASFTGVVGMKPTYGTVSRYGVVAMASSTDVIGPITHTAEDAALVLAVMSGRDNKDATTLPDFFAPTTIDAPLKIGVIKEWMDEGVDSEVRMAVTAAVERLKSRGHVVEEVSLPSLKYGLAVYYIVVPAEVASNLARYDGVRYGNAQPANNLGELYANTRAYGFMPENQRRIMIGNYVLSSGYYDAYYRKAQQVRTVIMHEFDDVLSQYDLLVGPVAPTPAFKLGENTDDPLKMYLADIMTVPASLAGLPAVSVPLPTDGLPIGLQIIGKQQADAVVLALAAQLQEED
ncbi:Asp-tRNA(Asn)/Glu-tRNA(Gln) amidotransferase subunit GatA [Candidatus Saccharibacteria bacterium]|nr:MAG: Asp-tRNA(Asn)/Glu-tRNA(Gln) amidotransferase subunit GatA [Candidatus Saccharibacteria bacterium]